MKIPNRLIGFVSFEDNEYPFEFDERTSTLKLYSFDKKEWIKRSSLDEVFKSIEQNNYKHEWAQNIELIGTTSERKAIIFRVEESPTNYNGFLSFQVEWFFCFNKEFSAEVIHGFRISGNEVEVFYPSEAALEATLKFKEDGIRLDKITVTTEEMQTFPCGEYKLINDTVVNTEVVACASYHGHTGINPIDSTSYIITTFSDSVDLCTMLAAYNNLKNFLRYVTYRNNVALNPLEVFTLDEENRQNYFGLLRFSECQEVEKHEQVRKRVIKYNVLTNKSSLILECINNKVLGMSHLCKSIDDRRHYPSSRIIMIFAAFECEFRNIYGKDVDRSEDYVAVKQEIINLIDEYISTQYGKRRSYAKQLEKYVDRRDNSFESNVRFALLDCLDILRPFIKDCYPEEVEEAIDNISSRMGEVRNGIAHYRLNLHFDAIHLCDIEIIEELLYAMRLKTLSMESSRITQAINALFHGILSDPGSTARLMK